MAYFRRALTVLSFGLLLQVSVGQAQTLAPNYKQLIFNTCNGITCEVLLHEHTRVGITSAYYAMRSVASLVGLRLLPATPWSAFPTDRDLLALADEIRGYTSTRNPPNYILASGYLSLTKTVALLRAQRTTAAAPAEPVLSPLRDRTIGAGLSIGPLPFSVCDGDSGPEQISVVASSSDEALLPSGNIEISGSGTTRTFKVQTLAQTEAVVLITFTATDTAGYRATRTFALKVVPNPLAVQPAQ